MQFIRAFWMLYLTGIVTLLAVGVLQALFKTGPFFNNLASLRHAWIVLFWPVAPFLPKSRKIIRRFTNINL